MSLREGMRVRVHLSPSRQSFVLFDLDGKVGEVVPHERHVFKEAREQQIAVRMDEPFRVDSKDEAQYIYYFYPKELSTE